MTTIKSVSGAAALNVDPYRDGTTDVAASRGTREVFRGIFKTADLLAALDATANTEVSELRSVVSALGESKAEPLAEWERELLDAGNNERDVWKARAEKAEETVKRVAALLVFGTIEADELHAALDPKPAFTLPTEAGVRFEARYGSGWETYTTYSDGNGGAIYRGDGGFNDGDYIMRCYTAHRLIGAGDE